MGWYLFHLIHGVRIVAFELTFSSSSSSSASPSSSSSPPPGVLYQQSSPAVRQVNDVPRKYRKTNREVPSKASPYVAAMLDPLKGFTAKDLKEEAVGREIVKRVLTQISLAYLRHTGDVLTSVQKMEESLKRLKKARGGGGGAAGAASGDAAAVSDDDKIRLQLALDVKAFRAQVESSFAFDAEDLEHFAQLRMLVVEATSGLTEFVADSSSISTL